MTPVPTSRVGLTSTRSSLPRCSARRWRRGCRGSAGAGRAAGPGRCRGGQELPKVWVFWVRRAGDGAPGLGRGGVGVGRNSQSLGNLPAFAGGRAGGCLFARQIGGILGAGLGRGQCAKSGRGRGSISHGAPPGPEPQSGPLTAQPAFSRRPVPADRTAAPLVADAGAPFSGTERGGPACRRSEAGAR